MAAEMHDYLDIKRKHVGAGATDLCLAAAEWIDRDIPPPDFLLGELLSTTSRAMLVAPTEIGKTNFAMALAAHVASGTDFLRWRVPRATRVLFIDGEMSRRLIKVRIGDVVRRIGQIPKDLSILCRDDIEEMPPLDTEKGQEFIDSVIEQVGAELVIFDNIQALIGGDMREEDSWRNTLPWAKSVTKRSIGQVWVHHTGHDETHSYGTKTREWQLDTVMLLERIDRPDTDIAFALKFTKARERAPHNRADFEPASIFLKDDEWQVEEGASALIKRKKKPLTASAKIALDLLRVAMGEAGRSAPASHHVPASASVIDYDLWRRYCYQGQVSDSDDQDAKRKAFGRAAETLIAQKIVGKWDTVVWEIGELR